MLNGLLYGPHLFEPTVKFFQNAVCIEIGLLLDFVTLIGFKVMITMAFCFYLFQVTHSFSWVDQRYVGLMWSLFLIGHLELSAIWHGLSSRMDTRRDMCSDEIGLCAQNVDTNSCSIDNTIGRAYVIQQT